MDSQLSGGTAFVPVGTERSPGSMGALQSTDAKAASMRQAPAGAASAGQGRAGFWEAVLGAHDDIDRLVNQLSANYAAKLLTTEADPLARLQRDARARLSLLREELQAYAQGDQAMLLLVIYMDEHIMHRLPEPYRLSWTPLQLDWLDSARGGEEFYRIVDHLLQNEQGSSILLEVGYFCLAWGFVGRYAGNLQIIEDYQSALKSRIAVPAVKSAASRSDPNTSLGPVPEHAHPAWYYALTVLAVILVMLVLTLLSRLAT